MKTIQIQKRIDTLVQRLADEAEATVKKALKKPGRIQRVLVRKTGKLIVTAECYSAADCSCDTVIVPSFQVPFLDLTPKEDTMLNRLILDELRRVLILRGLRMHQTREVVCVITPDPSRGEYVDNNIPLLGDHPGYV